MHAIRLHAFGAPEQLVLDEVPDLSPGPGEVRIAVEASGVHLLDAFLRRGETGGPMPPADLPTIPGREVAGVVDAQGPGLTEDWVGRRVVAHLGLVPGGYAEQAVTAEANLIVLPDHVGAADAIAAVGTGRTALGLLELEPVGADDVVLVLSAAGGLGWLLAQSARAAGATVVAAAGGPERTGLLAGRADLVVDYARSTWPQAVREGTDGVTVVYDGVGGAVGRQALELLRPGGRLVMFGHSAGEPTAFDSGDVVARALRVGWSLGPRLASLPGGIPGLARRAVARVADGTWTPLVTTYPLAQAARAHADLEQRRAPGKVVLVTGR